MSNLEINNRAVKRINPTKLRLLHFSQRIKYLLNWPKRSFFGKFLAISLTYSAAYTLIVRLIYGKDHPINRYNWNKLKGKGLLDPKLAEKERLFNQYLLDAYHHPPSHFDLGTINSRNID